MRYTSFSFKNFKGIQDTTISLAVKGSLPGVVALVGLNESGKTTVLEAIDHFVPRGDRSEIAPKDLLAEDVSDPFDLIPISQRRNFNDVVEVAATLSLDGADKIAIREAVSRATGFVITKLPDEVTVLNRHHYEASRFVKTTTGWTREIGQGHKRTGTVVRKINEDKEVRMATIEAMRSRVPHVWYFPDFLFKFPDEITLTSEPEESISNRLYRSLFQDILSSLDAKMSLTKHVVQRALSSDPGEQQSLKQLLLDMGREVTASVVSAWDRMFKSGQMRDKRVIIEHAVDANGRVSVRFLLEDSDGLFAVRERSLGFRWFFVYLLLTTYRQRRLDAGTGIVFLLDEPASNLHSSAQSLLLQSLETLSADAQVVYTTHSHHLINPAWLESTFVVSNDGFDPAEVTAERVTKATNIQVRRYYEFASQYPSRSHYFQPVLDVLDYQPSHLELVDAVVMAEGKSDYYLLRYFLEIECGLDQSSLRVLPGVGAGTLATPIQLYLAWGRKFVVLLDSDRAGDVARDKYRREFGELVEGRILDLATASSVPSARGIETLLSVEDRLKLQRVIDPATSAWSKKLWLRGLEHAFASGQKVGFESASRDGLDALVASLREVLRS